MRRRPLSRKTAVISGGSKGIGKETAKEFVLLGGSECIVARHREPLEIAVKEIRDLIQEDDPFVEAIESDSTDMERLLQNQHCILPGETGWVWRMNRLFPWLVLWLTDRQ